MVFIKAAAAAESAAAHGGDGVERGWRITSCPPRAAPSEEGGREGREGKKPRGRTSMYKEHKKLTELKDKL